MTTTCLHGSGVTVAVFGCILWLASPVLAQRAARGIMSGVATGLPSDEAERRPDVSRTPDAQGSAVPTARVTVRSEAGAYESSPRVLGDGAAFGYASWHQQARRAHLQ